MLLMLLFICIALFLVFRLIWRILKGAIKAVILAPLLLGGFFVFLLLAAVLII